jgi:16S rRNA (cytosine1402-N4)-methyltransferase
VVEGVFHEPVLVEEVLKLLEPERGGLHFDGTLGGGGHAEAILRRGQEARVIGVDRDEEALAVARRRLEPYGARVELVHGDYAEVAERVSEPLAGALLDLGISSHQIDETRRGFSWRRGAPLDMRMSQSADRTAADLLNEMSQDDLADVFRRYGEERKSRRLAAEIVKRRRTQPFRTSDDFVAAIQVALGGHLTERTKARLYQALRVELNRELEQLERALPILRDRLAPGGVLCAIAYHSLEARIIKQQFRDWSTACVCPPGLPVCVCGRVPAGSEMTRKAISPSEAEVASNPRARSAKLRAWRKAAA